MGAPGAGKSTWLNRNKTGFEHVYNTEAVRVNRELDVAAYMQIQRIKAVKAAESGKDVVADGTHTIATHRRFWLNLADRLGLDTRLVVFETPLQTCLDVQKTREYPAPRKVIVDHHQRMQMAKLHIRREGWDVIDHVIR